MFESNQKPKKQSRFPKQVKFLIIGALVISALVLVVLVGSPVTDIFIDETKIADKTNITVSGGKVKPSIIPWACGDNVTFTYKGGGVTYGTVTNNSKCWLDRNLGASQVATAYNDSAAYGDLFQWGRLDDGHQTRTSGTTATLSGSDNPGHTNFITNANSPYDWRSPQNDNLWQGVSGINNPCPSGWRIPTEAEWETERLSWSSNDRTGAYASPLKLMTGGSRPEGDSSLSGVGTSGFYWSSTVLDTFSHTYSRRLIFFGNGTMWNSDLRVFGGSVRCLKD